jgi:hypothetical protein
MNSETMKQPDFRFASESKKPGKAAVDGSAGIIRANAEVAGTPDQAFRALMTNKVGAWWSIRGIYRLKDWKADLRTQGSWSVTVQLHDGKLLSEWGEICEVDEPSQGCADEKVRSQPASRRA